MLNASAGTPHPSPVLIVTCSECESGVKLFEDGRPFVTIERASAFVIAWARGLACNCRPDDNHLKGLLWIRNLNCLE